MRRRRDFSRPPPAPIVEVDGAIPLIGIVVGLRHFATISSCRERRSSGATQGLLAGPPSSARNSTEGLLCFRRRFLKSAFQPGCQSNFTLGLLSVRIATFDSNGSSGNEVRTP
jgi:hypothetical protein